MLFDSAVAEQLYENYQYGDDCALRELLEMASPLIEVVALSVSPSQADDLAQEGRLKLMTVALEDSYDPSRGSMYSFLSSTLRFHMIDCMRKTSREDSEENCDEYEADDSFPCPLDSQVESEDIVEYTIARYPSLHYSVAGSVAEYIVSSSTEYLVEGSRGAVRTICVVHSLNRAIARTMYHGTMALMRMELVGMPWRANVDDALDLLDDCRSLEVSLVPEMVLALGVEKSMQVQELFRGSYVKF